MKPFEIPYNFDINLIKFLEFYQINIHCIYIAPFRQHYLSAKSYYQYVSAHSPQTLEEYEKHINYINSKFPNKLMLLLQQNKNILSYKYLKYYISLGIKKFCVGSIEQAKEIKNLIPEAEIIGSITMKIDNYKLLQNDYSLFDGFVLWFPFNRNIKNIEKLPKNFKYILLINCSCSIYCQGTQHWLAQNYFEEENIYKQCPKSGKFKDSIFIPKEDLLYFEPYISYYKLQGREYTTKQIINDIVYYTSINQCQELFVRNYEPQVIYNI